MVMLCWVAQACRALRLQLLGAVRRIDYLLQRVR